MTQELNCFNCRIKTSLEMFYIQTDQEHVQENINFKNKFDSEMQIYNENFNAYNEKVETYKSIVKEHNKNKSWWESEWIFEGHILTSACIKTKHERVTRYPMLYCPNHPVLGRALIHYITCPVCNNRHYINKKEYGSPCRDNSHNYNR